METNANADSALQYASIEILSGQHRYDAYVCVANKLEKLSSGALDHLLPFMPALKESYSKDSNCNFTLQLPENMHRSDWFTKSTFERYLYIINSPDLLAKIKPINQEMSQLEEGRKFQLSLFSENGAYVSSSDGSRNDLLRAMDSRLAALSGELAAVFAQHASTICSVKEVIAMADFSQLFGATDLENAFYRILETSQRSRIAGSRSGNRSSAELVAMNGNIGGSEIAVARSWPDQVEARVKYSVSPAKVAEVERQSSTGSEEEPSDSDREEQQTSAERSCALRRSALRRRSASPMRRVQIGRSGSRRASALNIKSLSYFPVRSVATQPETCEDDNEEDRRSDQMNKKVENEVRKMSVQDKIRIFESKQRDQAADLEKRSLANFSVCTSKSVLRRWSSGVGETLYQTSSHDEAKLVGEDGASVHSREGMPEEPKETMPENAEVRIEPGTSCSIEVDEYVKLRENEDPGSESISSLLDKEPAEEAAFSDGLASSAEWNQQKEAELNQMMMEMMETKNEREKSGQTRNQDIPVEQRGGFYDKYKQKRDERLQGENERRKAEKHAQFKVMQEVLNERRAEMGMPNAKDGKKAIVKKPLKSLRNSSQAAKPKKENHAPPMAKKASARTVSSLPAVRKSWPSTPTSRSAGVSPAKAYGTPSPARITPSRRKAQVASSVPLSTRPKPKPEQSPVKQKVVKEETRVHNEGWPKGGKDEKPRPVPKPGIAKVCKGAPNNGSAVVQVKPNVDSKVTRKSSVVPLESKPMRRRSGSDPLIKKETKESETYMNDCEDSKEEQCNDQTVANSDEVSLQETTESPSTEPPYTTSLEPEVPEIKAQECDKEESFGEGLDANRTGLSYVMDAVSEQAEEQTDISPMAWVEIEESADLPPLQDDSTFEFVPRTNIPPGGSSSSRVRHSLSQMLQEENSEADISEWGNAENPPSLIYQRDAAPKGLKKLLKFARKSKGDANLSGWSSPSVVSEGDDDVDVAKTSTKRSSENLLKEALHAKNFGPNESISGFANFQDGISSSTAPTAKATRSFFFLSAFRGGYKPGDAKLR